LFYRNYTFVSPFNTYLHKGLPPGPICNPGRASILAVLNAPPNLDDLYFVAKGGGRHLFASSYEQHLANIRTVRSRMPDSTQIGLDSVRAGPAAARTSSSRPGASPTGGSLTPPRRKTVAKSTRPPATTPPASGAKTGTSKRKG